MWSTQIRNTNLYWVHIASGNYQEFKVCFSCMQLRVWCSASPTKQNKNKTKKQTTKQQKKQENNNKKNSSYQNQSVAQNAWCVYRDCTLVIEPKCTFLNAWLFVSHWPNSANQGLGDGR